MRASGEVIPAIAMGMGDVVGDVEEVEGEEGVKRTKMTFESTRVASERSRMSSVLPMIARTASSGEPVETSADERSLGSTLMNSRAFRTTIPNLSTNTASAERMD